MDQGSILAASYLAFVQSLPGPAGFRLRYNYYKRRLKHLGDDVRIDVHVHIERPEFVSIHDHCAIDRGAIILAGPDSTRREKIVLSNPSYHGAAGEVHIGTGVHISPYCIVSGRAGVSIGDWCGIGAKATIHSFSHHYRSNQSKSNDSICMTPLTDHGHQAVISGPVVLAANVGVAINAAILPGVTVEKNSFISINSVLMPGSRYPENSLIGGSPARRLGDRFAAKAMGAGAPTARADDADDRK